MSRPETAARGFFLDTLMPSQCLICQELAVVSRSELISELTPAKALYPWIHIDELPVMAQILHCANCGAEGPSKKPPEIMANDIS